MVSAALLFGELKYEMYGNDFSGLNKIESLRKKVVVSEDSNFTKNYYEFSKRHISNSIEIVYDDNSTSEKITIENPKPGSVHGAPGPGLSSGLAPGQ